MVFVNRSSYAIWVLPSVAETATGVESVDAMTGVTAVGAVAAGREDGLDATSEDEPASLHEATTDAHAIAVTRTETFPRLMARRLRYRARHGQPFPIAAPGPKRVHP